VKKFKAICYLDDEQGRDAELIMPLVCFAEKFLNCKVNFCFVWDIHAIYRKKPDIVLLPNTVGSKWYFEISQYAAKQGIKVFALISEGNFRTNGTFNYWGYNTDKVYYQEFICHWSERTKNFLASELPEIAEKNVLTGATGFDRYITDVFPTKKEFLERRKLPDYKKIIGYAGWAFGKMFSDTGRMEIYGNHKEKAPERMKWMEEQMYKVEAFLKTLIENNPDILFILKRHPNETHPHITKESPNEMIRLQNMNNVLYVRDDEPIHDLIAVADIWTAFETTTAMEAWMLGKRTLLFNPDPDFTRDNVHKGSVIATNPQQAQELIDEFYQTVDLKAFNSIERKEARKLIIKETIGYDDGLNHARAGLYLKKTLDSCNRNLVKTKFSFKYFSRFLALKLGSLIYSKNLFLILPKFKKTIWIFERHRLKNLKILKEKKEENLNRFYQMKNLNTLQDFEKHL
jgi:surface carbohydrate biosynthesis protein